MLNGFPVLLLLLNVPALIPDLLRENSCVVYSIGSILEEMEEGGENHKKRKATTGQFEMWPRKGQDMRHNPQSAFWELMLGVTAWSAQPC